MATRQSSSSFLAFASLLLAGQAAASGFLATGPGARAAAMGGAFTGLADDSSAIYYNPAGLAGQRGALMLEHVPINESGKGLDFGDGRLDFVGIHYPSRIGTFGFGAVQFAIGGIEGRQTLAEEARDIKATQTALFGPYAVTLGGLALGVTGKAVTYSLGDYHGTGYGADVGAKAALFHGDSMFGRDTRLTAGLAVRNALAPKLRLYEDSASLEQTVAGGMALTSLVRESYDSGQNRILHDRFTLSMDVSRGNLDTPLSPAAGIEYAYLDRFALRGGYSSIGDITMGFGLGGPDSSFRFDYAADIAALAPQHRFTFSWLFTAPATRVESDVRLSAYRRARLDQERLKDRFVREGREAAATGDYEQALAAFQKALVLEPADQVVAGLVASSREGSRLAGVKLRLDEARRQRTARNDAKAAAAALQALVFDPQSREAAEYAVQLRNDIISSGTVADFDGERRRMVDDDTREFSAALADRNVAVMRRLVGRIKALDPDTETSWKPLERSLEDCIVGLISQYTAEVKAAVAAKDNPTLARAVRRLRRIDPAQKGLPDLEAKLRKASRRGVMSFYDANYLRQLYGTAAADYVLGNYDSAAQTLAVLLRSDAAHADANALVDRLRDDGRISEAQEP